MCTGAGSFAGTVSFPGGADGTTPIPLTAAGSYDAFVAKFDPANGACKWVRKVGGPGNDYLYGCFVSNSGNVYAGGGYTGTIGFSTLGGTVSLPNAGGLDGFIVKYDGNGNGIYASHMGSADNDEVKSIEYNGGDLVACGYMGNNCTFPAASGTIMLPTVGGSRDGWMGRINSLGLYVWAKGFGTIFNDEAMSVCLDPSAGNVFTAAQVADAPLNFNGTNHNGFGNNDIAVLGWNFYTQDPVWAKRVGSAGGDSPASIRWDGNRLVVAGYAGGPMTLGAGLNLTSNGSQEGVLIRYNKTTGAPSSGQMFGGNGNDRATALWCNTSTREEIVGGTFSELSTLPDGNVRQSKGGTDGYFCRVKPPAGLREGWEPVAETGLRIYPVPAGLELRISLGDMAANPTVIDAKGSLQSISFHTDGDELVLETSTLKPGLYVLRMGGKTTRFVKE